MNRKKFKLKKKVIFINGIKYIRNLLSHLQDIMIYIYETSLKVDSKD